MGFGSTTSFGSKSYGSEVESTKKGETTKQVKPEQPNKSYLDALKEKLRLQQESRK